MFREFHTCDVAWTYATSSLFPDPALYPLSTLCPLPYPLWNDWPSICCSQTHGYGTIHCHVVDLQVATALKILTLSSPSTRSHQLPLIPLLLMGAHQPIPLPVVMLTGLSSCSSCGFMSIATCLIGTVLLCSSQPLIIMFSVPPLLRWSLKLGGRMQYRYVLYLAEHSRNTCSLQFDQLWVSVLIITCC